MADHTGVIHEHDVNGKAPLWSVMFSERWIIFFFSMCLRECACGSHIVIMLII